MKKLPWYDKNMKAVIQRVKTASVSIGGKIYSSINEGLLVLLGVQKGDTKEEAIWLASKINNLRLFEDEAGKMNLSLRDINGEMLVVSQFTLLANCKKGTRPSFDNAMHPKDANTLYEFFVEECKKFNLPVKTGVFGAHMDVSLTNNGPVTILLEK